MTADLPFPRSLPDFQRLFCSVVLVHILSDWPESGVSEEVDP
jgi:hypothetical protein